MKSKKNQILVGIFAVLFLAVVSFFGIKGASKASDNQPEEYAATSSTRYAAQQAYTPTTTIEFPRSAYTGETLYTDEYTPKNRCRVEYQFTGLMLVSQVLDIHNLKVTQDAGTPGGTNVSGGEVVDYDPWPISVRIISNEPLETTTMLNMIRPPAGWLKGDWSKDDRYVPKAVIVYQNCLPAPTKPLPKR